MNKSFSLFSKLLNHCKTLAMFLYFLNPTESMTYGFKNANGNTFIWKDKKELCKIFRENDLKITIEANKTIVNFLDITLDLQSGKHYPCTKEGNVPLSHCHEIQSSTIYPEKHSGLNKQLSEISSDWECFDNAKTIYQEALNKSGYHYTVTCLSRS